MEVKRVSSAIAKNIKRILDERGMKQCAFAARAGYKNQTFNNMLNGRKQITAEDIPKICAAAGITPNELFLETT